jgi:hypothetical protein
LVASSHAGDPFEFRDQAILVRAAQAPTEPAHHLFHGEQRHRQPFALADLFQ